MDVVVKSESVSREHAVLVVSSPGGRSRLIDNGSTNGTRVLRRGRWQRIGEDMVDPEEHIKLGDYQTTPSALEKMARPRDPVHRERQRRSSGEYGHQSVVSGAERVADDRPSSVAVRRDSDGQVVPKDRR